MAALALKRRFTGSGVTAALVVCVAAVSMSRLDLPGVGGRANVFDLLLFVTAGLLFVKRAYTPVRPSQTRYRLWALALVTVVLVTMLVRGTGLRALGSATLGGLRYVRLLSPLFFLLLIEQTTLSPRQWRVAILALAAFSFLPAIADVIAVWFGQTAFHKFVHFSPTVATTAAGHSYFLRISGAFNSATLICVAAFAFIPFRARQLVVTWPFILLAFVLAGISGHRAALAILVAFLLALVWLDRVGKGWKAMAVAVGALVLGFGLLYGLRYHLPYSAVRTLQFIPQTRLQRVMQLPRHYGQQVLDVFFGTVKRDRALRLAIRQQATQERAKEAAERQAQAAAALAPASAADAGADAGEGGEPGDVLPTSTATPTPTAVGSYAAPLVASNAASLTPIAAPAQTSSTPTVVASASSSGPSSSPSTAATAAATASAAGSAPEPVASAPASASQSSSPAPTAAPTAQRRVQRQRERAPSEDSKFTERAAKRLSTSTVRWRFKLWTRALAQVPRYWLLGKGLSYDRHYANAIEQSQGAGTVEWAIITSTYHSPLLNLLLCFGVFGLVTGVGLLVFGFLRHWRLARQSWHDAGLQRIHRVLFAYFVARAVVSIPLGGDIANSYSIVILCLALLEGLAHTDRSQLVAPAATGLGL